MPFVVLWFFILFQSHLPFAATSPGVRDTPRLHLSMFAISNLTFLARTQLPEPIQVRGNDVGDLRIPADGLAVDAEDDALAIVDDLHRAGADRLRDEFPGLRRNGSPCKRRPMRLLAGSTVNVGPKNCGSSNQSACGPANARNVTGTPPESSNSTSIARPAISDDSHVNS